MGKTAVSSYPCGPARGRAGAAELSEAHPLQTPLGNRESASGYDSPTRVTDYNPNELNQYENALTDVDPKLIPQGFRYDADGNLSDMFVVGDANCDGAVNNSDINCFVAAASGDYQAYQTAGGSAACWAERHDWGDFDGDGQCTNLDIDPFVDLLGANGSGAAIALRFEWDGENRLTRVTYPDDCGAGMPNGFQRVSFKYDYLGRRIEKKVETCNASGASWSTASWRRYVYDQWNLLLELNASSSNAIVRKYTWGLDLAGQSGDASASGLHGAGGIGGLLAVDVQSADPDTTETGGFWYCFDANGNVMQLVAGANGYGGATGDEWHADRLKARYEYDPYGILANTPSAFGMTNPYRFSTKYWVDQFGMGDWGHRWYDPRVGRWVSRNPMGERAGLLVYSYLSNRAPYDADPRVMTEFR